MSSDPDVIRSDIERTRAELSSDVDALTDKVSPKQVVHRQAEKVRSTASDVRDRVMGAVSDTADATGSAASSLGEKATDLPARTRERAQGSPLAAGLIAFGAGLLVASVLPSSRREQELAQSAKDHAAPVVDEVKSAAQDVAANLKEPAQQAAQSVKDTAASAASDLRDEGRTAAQDVKAQATGGEDSSSSPHGAHLAGDEYRAPGSAL
jgi:ElaB/YqjD/DUF883 family membrane-anchored ribosome-binding protein